MRNFIYKVVLLIGVIANFILFIISVVAFIFILISGNTIDSILDNIKDPFMWLGFIFSSLFLVYSFVISIIALVRLIGGKSLNIVSYNLVGLTPFLIATGIFVFGFNNLTNTSFSFFFGIFIAYVVIDSILLVGSILNYRR